MALRTNIAGFGDRVGLLIQAVPQGETAPGSMDNWFPSTGGNDPVFQPAQPLPPPVLVVDPVITPPSDTTNPVTGGDKQDTSITPVENGGATTPTRNYLPVVLLGGLVAWAIFSEGGYRKYIFVGGLALAYYKLKKLP